MNQEEEKNLIDNIINDFYEKAKGDFLIGYHFRHIKNFDDHIPKIQRFWHLILLELSKEEQKAYIQEGIPNNIIEAHQYLKIKPGEVGRWIVLFKQVQAQYKNLNNQSLIQKWEKKINQFEKIFLSSKILFP